MTAITRHLTRHELAARFRCSVSRVDKLRASRRILHIKDGPLEKDKAMVAVGDGIMNIPEVISAADPNVLEWLIVELDTCDTDMLAAVAKSYRYLTENELAEGSL